MLMEFDKEVEQQHHQQQQQLYFYPNKEIEYWQDRIEFGYLENNLKANRAGRYKLITNKHVHKQQKNTLKITSRLNS